MVTFYHILFQYGNDRLKLSYQARCGYHTSDTEREVEEEENEGEEMEGGSEWASGGEKVARSVLSVGCALSHMLLQSARHSEGHITKGATEAVHPGPAMCFHVPGQFAALCTGVGTHLTLVWFLPCVTSLVYRQVTAVLENFTAELATVVSSVTKELFASLKTGM